MYDIAKKGRDALKSKARRIAAGDSMKVDSSDWSPAPLLNADKKTGARPIGGGRLYNKGGKVVGKAVGGASKARADRPGRATGGAAVKFADAMASKDMRRALGTAHVGAFKRGGEASVPSAAETHLTKDRVGSAKVKPTRGAAQNYKRGGKAEGGESMGAKVKGVLHRLTGYETPEKQYQKQYGQIGKDGGTRYDDSDKAALGKMLEGKKHGGRHGKDMGGKIADVLNRMVGYKSPAQKLEEGLKNVGKGSGAQYTQEMRARMGEAARGESPTGSAEEAMEKSGRTGDKHGGRAHHASGGKNWIKDAIKKPGALRKSLGVKEGENIPAKKLEAAAEKPGKMGQRARLAQTLKRMGRKAGGGVNLTVVVSEKGKGPMPGGPVDMPPVPPMGPPPGAPPMPMMPPPPPVNIMAGAAGAPPAQMPMGRKAGGRISKVASSYKDMEAGAASGEGRLQKTDIAKKHHGAPARKTGGKVYKSYKDMDAGAGSGDGRLEKTEIEARKMARRA